MKRKLGVEGKEGEVYGYSPDENGVEQDVTYYYRVLSYTPADEGRTSGPPERCYPPEPEILEFQLYRDEGRTVLMEEDELPQSEWDRVEEKIKTDLFDW